MLYNMLLQSLQFYCDFPDRRHGWKQTSLSFIVVNLKNSILTNHTVFFVNCRILKKFFVSNFRNVRCRFSQNKIVRSAICATRLCLMRFWDSYAQKSHTASHKWWFIKQNLWVQISGGIFARCQLGQSLHQLGQNDCFIETTNWVEIIIFCAIWR